MKNRRKDSRQVGMTPAHEKLSWPGLTARDHLTRVVTRAVKEAKETRERKLWAETVIGRMLDYVTAEVAIKLIVREAKRRRIKSLE